MSRIEITWGSAKGNHADTRPPQRGPACGRHALSVFVTGRGCPHILWLKELAQASRLPHRAAGPCRRVRERGALMAGGTPALLWGSVLATRHRHGAATPQPTKTANGGWGMEKPVSAGILPRGQGILPGMAGFSMFDCRECEASRSHPKPPQSHPGAKVE
jgi:hypothetical protein